MKLCIPTQTNDGMKAQLCDHFGSAPHFMIYEVETDNYEFVSNTNMHHTHGMCQPLSIIGDKQIDAIVCRGMGMGAFQKLKYKGIKAFKAETESVEQLIKNYKSNLLEEISLDGTCQGHGCH